MSSELSQYLNSFLDPVHPVYLSIFWVTTIFVVVVIFLRIVVLPLIAKHREEKEQLVQNQIEMIAHVTELDPNPVFRIAVDGSVIYRNSAAGKLFPSSDFKTIESLIGSVPYPITQLLETEGDFHFDKSIGNRIYNVLGKGSSLLGSLQIYMMDITLREKALLLLRKEREKTTSLSMDIQKRIEAEKTKIAGEVHDGLGQEVILLKLLISESLDAKKQLPLSDVKTRIDRQFDKIIQGLRDIAGALRPQLLNDFGLKTALEILNSKISSDNHLSGSITILGYNKRYNDDWEISLYRLIQESLTNIVKHAHAASYSIFLEFDHNELFLKISDDGIGFNASDIFSFKGFGLVGIHERVKGMKGNFKIHSDSEGTIIEIKTPVVEKESFDEEEL